MEPNQNQNTTATPEAIPPTPSAPPTWRVILDNLKPLLASLFAKFYANKKVFWPVTILFGLLFLLLIAGLLFGKRTPNQPITNLPTSTPFILSTPTASSSGDILSTSESKLNNLKTQIDNLDVKQSRLQPPSLNYDIKF